jgi:enterochelin esterase-like enzyme
MMIHHTHDTRTRGPGSRAGLLTLLTLLLAAPLAARAQVKTPAPPPVVGAKPAVVQKIKVHSVAVEGNLEGESADRDVFVVLPPGYASHPKRRYPVVYALHGYSIGAQQWMGEIHVPQTIEGAFAKGAGEMIVVLPDSKTVHNGSMYSSSRTTGDFETFIARDLVAYIDKHYRTLPVRESRGLVGHSMGGYGASRIGMRHADVFGALYMMSPCCLSPRDAGQLGGEGAAALAQVKTLEDAQKLPWGLRAQLATAAAWSPNPDKPPLFLDLPVENGVARPEILAKWARQRAPGLRGPVCFRSWPLQGHRHRCRRPRRPEGRRGQAACGAGSLRDRQQLRDLCRRPHQWRFRPTAGQRPAVLQPPPGLPGPMTCVIAGES